MNARSRNPWPLIALGLLAVGIFALLLVRVAHHPAIGTWKGASPLLKGVPIAVYPRGRASLAGIACSWDRIDRRTIRLELTGSLAEKLPLVAELQVAPGGDKATLSLAMIEIRLVRLR